MHYLIVENNIVTNRVVGTHDTAQPDWIEEKDYDVGIGWEYLENSKVFVRPGWTDVDWQNFYQKNNEFLQDHLSFYSRLVKSEEMKKFDENKTKQINEYLNELLDIANKMEKNVGAIYKINDLFYKDPLPTKPNLDNEV